jgi:hypothetical protein
MRYSRFTLGVTVLCVPGLTFVIDMLSRFRTYVASQFYPFNRVLLSQAQDDNLLRTKVHHGMKKQKGTCTMRSLPYKDWMPQAYRACPSVFHKTSCYEYHHSAHQLEINKQCNGTSNLSPNQRQLPAPCCTCLSFTMLIFSAADRKTLATP